MNKLIVLLTFTLLTFEAHACLITTFSNIVKVNKIDDFINVIKKSDCPKKVNKKFISFIKNNSGDFNTKLMNRYIGEGVNITPKEISISNITTFLNNHLANKKIVLNSVKLMGKKSPVLFNEKDEIQIECKQCDSLGNVNLKIIKKNSTFWGSAVAKGQIIALVAKKRMGFSQNNLSQSDFKKKLIYTSNPERIFTDFKNVHFFKMNKNIKENHALLASDVSTIYLIQVGQPVRILLEENGLRLTTTAIALRSGKLGDVIAFKKQSSNKKIFAKIIDYNKARIEL
jgi:flagella basal body P-ring formation protein FlgA